MSDLYHRPRLEEQEYGKPSFYVCELDDEVWPCDHELDLMREEEVTMTTLHEPDDLLTPGQVAALFNVNVKTVTRWTKDGKLIAAIRTLGGHRRYRYSDIEAALDAASHR